MEASDKKRLIFVIGRSGSGKDTLIRHAQKVFNIASVPSYTDRPMRSCETDGIEHTFLTKEDFDHLVEKEVIFAYTRIGETGYRYCTTLEMLRNIKDDTIFYTIDPKGWSFCKKFSDIFDMTVVYVHADEAKRMERANIRNGDKDTWKKRTEDENRQFDEFEENHEWDMLVDNSGELEAAKAEFIEKLEKILNK